MTAVADHSISEAGDLLRSHVVLHPPATSRYTWYSYIMDAIGYLITIRTYGTWPRGDDRGSVDIAHNRVGTPFIAPDPLLARSHTARLKYTPLTLTKGARECAHTAMSEALQFREIREHAISVRTQHAHIVCGVQARGAVRNPERIMGWLKMRATRALIAAKHVDEEREVWEDHGSTPYLHTPEDIERAVWYVLNEQ